MGWLARIGGDGAHVLKELFQNFKGYVDLWG
jgi:hypothetical protein